MYDSGWPGPEQLRSVPKQGMEFRLYLRLKRSSVSRFDARMSIIGCQNRGWSLGFTLDSKGLQFQD